MEQGNQDSFIEFSRNIRKASSPRKYKNIHSYGILDYYRFYRQTVCKVDRYKLKYTEFSDVLKCISKKIVESVLSGHEVVLPARMGALEVRKQIKEPKLVDGELVFNTVIDWYETLKLWYEDQQARENKTLIKREETQIFRVHYVKSMANYKNKGFFKFRLRRPVKKLLAGRIINNEIDAFDIYSTKPGKKHYTS